MLSNRLIAIVFAAIILAPASARADVLFIPFFGVNFGGDAGKEISDSDENNVAWCAGGGVLLFFWTRAGLRFDGRYFRTFDDLELGPIRQVWRVERF